MGDGCWHESGWLPSSPFGYLFSALTRIAAGARDLSRRNVSTALTRPQNSKASFAHQHPCELTSALGRSRGDQAKHMPVGRERVTCLVRWLRRRQGVGVVLLEIRLLPGTRFWANPNPCWRQGIQLGLSHENQ